ncbi:transporter substrate-binding domain-containing protein [Synechococcus sp. RSCCF101]|uniref:extracellular substrate binding-like orphan protein GrrP n=1 Tax=Synechococcus sp. RSCCF101 TaxID=2511069 RepID=UPI00124474CD|nr:extracellular substrate binding-like orphan protein GrrP [Synechococcus sp. RSCCF101]QEY31022.1 transporter substrate-binding domain-containing protein [Synechococcus sp. RSCCF101]
MLRRAAAAGLLAVLGWLGPGAPALAETAVEKAARTGVLGMGVPEGVPPYASLAADGSLQGYAVDVSGLIAEELSDYLGKPISVVSVTADSADAAFQAVHRGDIDLFCGAQFTWRREMFVDFTTPFALSGIRLLTAAGGPDGTPASLAGKRIGAVAGSLGATTLEALQPQATLVPIASLADGLAALRSGRVDGVIGDTLLIAGAVAEADATDLDLVPETPYNRYAVGCMVPENNGTLRNLASLAIGKMVQGYVNGEPRYVELVNRWLGPDSDLELPTEAITAFFNAVLLSHEQIAVPPVTTP